ncbi:MAG TPA: glycosyltransferase family 4 protein [Candidatus Nanoarchaeia archaeon]|nr:glycosyltransferase family 4 protein [Candidatus Nanoarchaeia archaeon]
MDIALLSTGFYGHKEATAITILDLATELSNLGNKVTLITESRGEKIKYTETGNLTIYRTGSEKSKSINNYSIYNRILAHPLAVRKMQLKKGEKFEVIHSFSSAPIFVLRSLLAKAFSPKAKIIHTLKSYSREGLGNKFYRLLNRADIVTVPTQIFADKIIKKGVNKNKIRVIRSNINIQKFVPRDKLKLKQELGLDGKKIILYYGALWEKKGVDYLIEAMPEVLAQHPKIVFIFAPRNLPYGYKYKPRIDKFPHNSLFLEKEVQIEKYVALADLVILPYPDLVGTEGNPSCLLEALACKTAVVTTDLPELREIAEKCVFMAKPKDTKSLAETIIRALNEPSPEMIERAYLKAQEFSKEKVAKEFLRIYKGIID